ncbi:RNA-guided endonuclease InsQ/TnpB family protein [Polaromonas sp. JS666]|uniref:RNA-guided endonuclease InsQ/TnpB family protein n=1 Tax=Polaromonas sp. (strain JS666 / ATCC BAA-500) TaxID=296591 RepID=UPI00059D16F1
MSMLRAYRFQLRCKPEQEKALRRSAGCARWIWNAAIAEQRRRYAAGEKYAGYAEMCKWLTTWRNAPETIWLSEAPIPPQQQALKRLHEAYQRFFAKAGGYPSFKRRGEEPGLRFPAAAHFQIDQPNQRIKVMKLGWLRIRQSQVIDGTPKNLSLSKEGARWYVSIQVELPDVLPAAGLDPSLAIDVGLTVFAATSAGVKIKPLLALRRQARYVRRAQKSVSRKVKGSANRKKAVYKLGDLHRRIARQREDWLHKLTTELADRHPIIALEDLRIKNMSASAKGTKDAPGKNIRQKAGLNRSILDAAWGEFGRQLQYKLQWRGGQLVLVEPAYSSQTCAACGHVAAENRKSQALFKCVACGHAANADLNAAQVLLQRAKEQWAAGRAAQAGESSPATACGEVVRHRPARKRSDAASVKQEPSDVLT